MEGEKEASEEEEDLHHIPGDHQELPIMHWEELNQRISELEEQEQERREKRKNGADGAACLQRRTGLRTEEKQGGDRRNVCEEDEEDSRRSRVAASRLNHRNLQLCFINNSDSEEEEGADRKVPMGAGHNGCHGAGLKQEVAAALRALRDDLLAEQKEEEEEVVLLSGQAGCSCVAQREHLERWQLQGRSLQTLRSLKASLQQEVHALSSELVAHLLVRDQLRTKQDAMLLDVQDLT
ncbi:schwannomin-interacting protein 1 isoform X2 [Fundulus heteroclitus]|uniref:schwannomin-interacting protein 1 isoform X2 n=1 Tax=Fundulus heteroclitus TaxID=8078 RepID=UPI00165A9174|nr:schwannomin-interacting protein 1 isoform X2 [Fundulus heteroclitus]